MVLVLRIEFVLGEFQGLVGMVEQGAGSSQR